MNYKDRANTFIRMNEHLKSQGLSWHWKPVNQWRTTWGIFGIKVQVKEYRITRSPGVHIPLIIDRWKTVFTL